MYDPNKYMSGVDQMTNELHKGGGSFIETFLKLTVVSSPFLCLWGMYYVYQHQATAQATMHMNWIVLECLLALLFIIIFLTLRSIFRWGKRRIRDKDGKVVGTINYGLSGYAIIPGLFIVVSCYGMYFLYQHRTTLHYNWLEGEFALLIGIAVSLGMIYLLSL